VKVVLCSAPVEAAHSLASTLVAERVAACVSVVGGVSSVYRWDGEVERAGESLLVAKTSDASVSALTERIAQIHPYSVPEIVVVDVLHVNAKYAAWVDAETRPASFVFDAPKESVLSDDVGSVRGVLPRAVTRSSCMEGSMKKKKAKRKAAKKSTAKKTKKRRK
jgi:periplasmic divalent cation tolerance protein